MPAACDLSGQHFNNYTTNQRFFGNEDHPKFPKPKHHLDQYHIFLTTNETDRKLRP